MKLNVIYKLTGYSSIVLGLIATLSIYRIQYVKIGIAIAILGFITAGINIFLNTKYFYDYETYPKGYWGMFLSSLPVLFLLFFIMKHR